MLKIHIFFVYKEKRKIFTFFGATKKDAVNELHYLYGKDVNILGIRKKSISNENYAGYR